MDPISILGTALTALEIGTRLTVALGKLIHSWKSAPLEILALHNDVSDLNVVLNQIRNALRTAEDNPLHDEEFSAIVTGQLVLAKALMDELATEVGDLQLVRGPKRRLRWLRHGSAIEKKD